MNSNNNHTILQSRHYRINKPKSSFITVKGNEKNTDPIFAEIDKVKDICGEMKELYINKTLKDSPFLYFNVLNYSSDVKFRLEIDRKITQKFKSSSNWIYFYELPKGTPISIFQDFQKIKEELNKKGGGQQKFTTSKINTTIINTTFNSQQNRNLYIGSSLSSSHKNEGILKRTRQHLLGVTKKDKIFSGTALRLNLWYKGDIKIYFYDCGNLGKIGVKMLESFMQRHNSPLLGKQE